MKALPPAHRKEGKTRSLSWSFPPGFPYHPLPSLLRTLSQITFPMACFDCFFHRRIESVGVTEDLLIDDTTGFDSVSSVWLAKAADAAESRRSRTCMAKAITSEIDFVVRFSISDFISSTDIASGLNGRSLSYRAEGCRQGTIPYASKPTPRSPSPGPFGIPAPPIRPGWRCGLLLGVSIRRRDPGISCCGSR